MFTHGLEGWRGGGGGGGGSVVKFITAVHTKEWALFLNEEF